MPATFFQFKQFTVHQELCGMKVCTDACIFGAAVEVENHRQILDIGTGTGLLTLMLAQRNASAQFTAVELDEAAVLQAKQNFEASHFSSQLKVVNTPIQDFQTENTFDLIVSNPPFFENSLHTANTQRDKALHHSSLTFSELAYSTNQLLTSDGFFWLLLPPREMQNFMAQAATLLPYFEICWRVRHDASKPVIREIARFSKTDFEKKQTRELHIYSEKKYSTDFVDLLKDYYIIF